MHYFCTPLAKLNYISLSALLKQDLGLKTVAEFRFHPVRKWRADCAIPDKKILIEFEGGNYKGGRHTRGQGYAKDCEKYNQASVLGYRVLRYTHSDFSYNDILKDVKAIIS